VVVLVLLVLGLDMTLQPLGRRLGLVGVHDVVNQVFKENVQTYLEERFVEEDIEHVIVLTRVKQRAKLVPLVKLVAQLVTLVV
jgi:hypothetical protein